MRRRLPLIKYLTTLLLFLFLEGLSLFLITQNSLYQRIRLQALSIGAVEKVAKLNADIRHYTSLAKSNALLVEENLLLRNLLQKSGVATAQNYPTYRPPHSNLSPLQFSFQSARVLSNSTNRLNNFFILDKGERDGVESGMGVLSTKGVVGVVEHVTEHFSMVTSLLNINQSISAKVLPSGAFGTLKWEGGNRRYVTLKEIPHHIKIEIGDTVATSGYSLIFPANIPIGVVDKFSLEGGAHYNIEVELLQEFNTLNFVNIITNHNKRELDSLNSKIERDG
ncbi:MAG: rod shape-determining protein MreC [Bacteroidales bacterium]